MEGAPPHLKQKEPNEPILRNEQIKVIRKIKSESNHFNTWLLNGITGSGKTEVYLRLIALQLLQGRQTLVLIPEISLTPQMETVFQVSFSFNRNH